MNDSAPDPPSEPPAEPEVVPANPVSFDITVEFDPTALEPDDISQIESVVLGEIVSIATEQQGIGGPDRIGLPGFPGGGFSKTDHPHSKGGGFSKTIHSKSRRLAEDDAADQPEPTGGADPPDDGPPVDAERRPRPRPEPYSKTVHTKFGPYSKEYNKKIFGKIG